MKTSISNAQVNSNKARKEITLIQPKFDSKLCDLILDLERQRSAQPLYGTTSPSLFNKLKKVLFVLERWEEEARSKTSRDDSKLNWN